MEGTNRGKLKLICRLGVVILLLHAAILMTPGASAQGADPVNGDLHVKVLTDFIVVREGRGDGTPMVAQIPQGGEATVIGDGPTAGWWQVRLDDGREGWVSGGEDAILVVGADGKALPNDSPKTAHPPTGMLVFQTSSGGDIYIINADGTGLRKLTHGMDPALSPDRQWVAFTRWDLGEAGLYIIRTDGTGERQLFAEPMVKAPAWSADGTQIAVTHQNGGHVGTWEKVVTMPRGGRGGGGGSSGKSPKITMLMPADPKWKIGLVRVVGGYFTELASHDSSFSPTFSPSGKIAYASDKGISLTWENAPSAVTRDPNMATVSDMRFNDRSPVYSPDGTRIAFQYKTSDRSQIFVMNADGSGRTALTHQDPLADVPVSNVSPTWSPDGTQIAYFSNPDGMWDIWVIDATGDNPHPLFKAGTLKDLEFDYQNMDERMVSWR